MPAFFSLVKDLNSSTTLWAMRLRVVRAYDVPTFGNSDQSSSFEFVFHDKEMSRIHATVQGSAMLKMQTKPIEGHLYALKDFLVVNNNLTFKTTPNQFKIVFLQNTKFAEIFDENFPTSDYEFKLFHEFPSRGLCNGTRLILTKLGDHVLEAKIITGASAGQLVLIPRLSMTPSNTKIPFKFQRRQFPLTVSYAMTINKSQGQSLSHVGLFLRKPVFSHGQLYVAFSRVTNRDGLKVMICDDEKKHINTTHNVVYKEVFRNL